MKEMVLALVVLLSVQTSLHGDELVWDYSHGWTQGFVLKIETETGKVRLHDRNKDVHLVADLPNSTNVVAYLKALLERIPGDSIGKRAIDGEVSKVAVSGQGKSIMRTIYVVYPPGGIPYNEGYSAGTELREAEIFRKNIDGFLIRDMLFQIAKQIQRKETDLQQAPERDRVPAAR